MDSTNSKKEHPNTDKEKKKSKIKSEMLKVKSENFIVVKKKIALNIILQY